MYTLLSKKKHQHVLTSYAIDFDGTVIYLCTGCGYYNVRGETVPPERVPGTYTNPIMMTVGIDIAAHL